MASRRLAETVLGWLPDGGSVAVLGLAYKPNTDVVEESPGMYLAQLLVEKGVPVAVFDPAGMTNARRSLEDVHFAESADEAVHFADVVVITTPWQEFAGIAPHVFARPGTSRVVIDCWRILTSEQFEGTATYVALGESSEPQRATALD